MEDFIGNNAKAIVDWGQLIAASIAAISIFLIYHLGRKNRFFLPKGFVGYILATILLIMTVLSSLIFIKVKP